MKGTNRLKCWLLAVCLSVGLLIPPASAASDIYLTSVNDTLLTLTAETMPYRSGGVLYVPYTVFDSSSSGVSLGITCTYNRNRNTVILYNNKQILTFYLESGICYDEMTGDTYEKKAALHNGIPFVALDMVCLFFDLAYTYSLVDSIPQGYLVRVKNEEVVLSDAKFIDAASNLIGRRYQSYLQSLPTADATGSTALPPASPSEVEREEHEVSAYLAFLCEERQQAVEQMELLARNRTHAVFFVSPELIEQEDDLIRCILGTGHSIGIRAGGETEEETRAILEEGNRLLEQLTYTRTTLAYAPEGHREALEEKGWICWEEGMHLQPSATVGAFAYSDRIVNQLEDWQGDVFLTLSGADVQRILSALLRRLKEEQFVVEIPLETKL